MAKLRMVISHVNMTSLTVTDLEGEEKDNLEGHLKTC